MLTLDEEVTSVTEAEAYRYTHDDLRRKLRTPSRPSSNATQTQLHTVTAEKRHSAAMQLLHSGVDISVIALWLGHESWAAPRFPDCGFRVHLRGEL
jgi:site-specific recombinase XerD